MTDVAATEVVSFIEVSVLCEDLGICLKQCKGLLGGVFIHSKSTSSSSVASSCLAHTTSSSHVIRGAGSSSRDGKGQLVPTSRPPSRAPSSYQSPPSPHPPATNSAHHLFAHVGAVLYSINNEVVVDLSLEAVNRKLAAITVFPLQVKLIDARYAWRSSISGGVNRVASTGGKVEISISIVDIVKDPRMIKYLYEYLLTTNEVSEELLGSTTMASVSILVNHYKEMDNNNHSLQQQQMMNASGQNSDSILKTSPNALSSSSSTGKSYYHSFEGMVINSSTEDTNINNTPSAASSEASIKSYQFEGICDDIARDLDCSFLPKFLASEVASRMFGYLYKCPAYFHISPSIFLNNYLYMMIYYFFLASLNSKCENTMQAIWKSLNSNDFDDAQVGILSELCGITPGCGINPETIFTSNYLLGELFLKFKASDYYDLVMIHYNTVSLPPPSATPSPVPPGSNLDPTTTTFNNNCSLLFTSEKCLCRLEKLPLRLQNAPQFGAANIFQILKKKCATIGNISFHKSRYNVSTHQNCGNNNTTSSRGDKMMIYNPKEVPTDVWIASIDNTLQIIDYFKIASNKNTSTISEDEEANIGIRRIDLKDQDRIMLDMERNAPFIMPNFQTTVSLPRAHFKMPKLISGSFTSAEGKTFFSLSLLYYEVSDDVNSLPSNPLSPARSSHSTSSFSQDDFSSTISSIKVNNGTNDGVYRDSSSSSPGGSPLELPMLNQMTAASANIPLNNPGKNAVTSKLESTFRLTSEIFSSMFTNTSSFFDQSNQLNSKSTAAPAPSTSMPPSFSSPASSLPSLISSPVLISVLSHRKDDVGVTDISSDSTKSTIAAKQPFPSASSDTCLPGNDGGGGGRGVSSSSSRLKFRPNGSRGQSNLCFAVPKGLSIISNQDISYLRSFLAGKYASENSVTINPKDISFEIESYIQFTNKEPVDCNITHISDGKDLQLMSYFNRLKDQNSFIVSNSLKWPTILDLITATVLECKIILWSRISGTVLRVIIDWLKETIQPFEWCHSCATSIHAQSLKQLEDCPTPFLFGLYSESIDFEDPEVLVIDVDSGVSLQVPTIFKKIRSVIDRFGNSMSFHMGASIYNYDSMAPESPWNYSCVNKSSDSLDLEHPLQLRMHQKIDVNCKRFVDNLVKHVKICCLTQIKFSVDDHFEVIFNDAIYFHLLRRDKIKIERSIPDKCFFDLIIRTQMFSNLICSHYEGQMADSSSSNSENAAANMWTTESPSTSTISNTTSDDGGEMIGVGGSMLVETFTV